MSWSTGDVDEDPAGRRVSAGRCCPPVDPPTMAPAGPGTTAPLPHHPVLGSDILLLPTGRPGAHQEGKRETCPGPAPQPGTGTVGRAPGVVTETPEVTPLCPAGGTGRPRSTGDPAQTKARTEPGVPPPPDSTTGPRRTPPALRGPGGGPVVPPAQWGCPTRCCPCTPKRSAGVSPRTVRSHRIKAPRQPEWVLLGVPHPHPQRSQVVPSAPHTPQSPIPPLPTTALPQPPTTFPVPPECPTALGAPALHGGTCTHIPPSQTPPGGVPTAGGCLDRRPHPNPNPGVAVVGGHGAATGAGAGAWGPARDGRGREGPGGAMQGLGGGSEHGRTRDRHRGSAFPPRVPATTRPRPLGAKPRPQRPKPRP